MWGWIWPRVGATPVSQNTDSEMFDRMDYPYMETFVREAIQNTLDARLDLERPAVIHFKFHSGSMAALRPFLEGAVSLREAAGLPVPQEWHRDDISWLTIEDFNTKGLDGDLADRSGNFWNYWLNFGLSNKDGHGRGGRGIGRVTFLIASRMQAVVGFTRRKVDGRTAACGMTLLKPMIMAGTFRSTHAYLAAEEDLEKSVYRLHDTDAFHEGVMNAFGFSGYGVGAYESGLALAIPYPHKELEPAGILASSIEHFAPAIIGKSLVVRVDSEEVDENSIDRIAVAVRDAVRADWIKEDVGRYLSLVKHGLEDDMPVLDVDTRTGLAALNGGDSAEAFQKAVATDQIVKFRLRFDLPLKGSVARVSLKAVAARTPEGMRPADRFFREGMSLPDVRANNPGELDVLLLVEDVELATYLNFCEGKAHLDLLESKEVRAKLEERGYGSPPMAVKRFVKKLPVELRTFLTPQFSEPENDVFDAFFSIPEPLPGKRGGAGGRPEVTPPPPEPPPPPQIPTFRVRTLADGFRLEANPDFDRWPMNVSVTMAYADGTRSPAWSEHDFRSSDLSINVNDCEYGIVKNKLTARGVGKSGSIEVTGFDSRRELDTRIKVWKHAQDN